MGAAHLTISEKKQIRALYNEGKTIKEICAVVGRSQPCVSKVAKRKVVSTPRVATSAQPDWKALYLGAVAKLAEAGLL